MSPPTLAIVAAGAMGAAVGRRLTTAGLTVLTDLSGRSLASQKRAADAGMQDASLSQIAAQANWVLSILPPSEAYAFAERFRAAHAVVAPTRKLGFADCNAVNPTTVKRIAALFEGTPISFVDAGIVGGPPKDGYNPVFYASASPEQDAVLDDFTSLTKYDLNVKPLRGEGAGVGDASALKMSYAGITKGMIGLWSTMILAAHAASPATATALMHELADSQPMVLQKIIGSTSTMPGKAYRWIGEMEEISDFVSDGLTEPGIPGEGQIHQGLARLYERIASAVKDGEVVGEDVREVKILRDFAREAKAATQPKN
ncbi:hypothetical protein PHLGIDRAFT_137784 [Phlebiopsis gigantea 11061_1 CR5-6]|uniref:Phosphogluconate dehydrogenase NAD-binding putative C-terminal domain-containing protein n=1 Tax=Phlebiopsis gigantea (strain 11061_1 CR5-6) TaxID=745531 RepID=A0A0C3S881_PHLG1|nr:hypothetical protein PHLGIDRAFT_137784 [Phlebiopsis gigantea 11061_1 CR5-6]